MLFCDCGCKVTTIFYITKIFQKYFVDYFEKSVGSSPLIFSFIVISDRKKIESCAFWVCWALRGASGLSVVFGFMIVLYSVNDIDIYFFSAGQVPCN